MGRDPPLIRPSPKGKEGQSRTDIQESSKSDSKTIAKEAERARRRELEESWNQIKPRKLPPLFSVAAEEWLKTRTGIAPVTEKSYRLAIDSLGRAFGKRLLCDLSGADVAEYQKARLRDELSPRTANLEVGVLRAILRRYRMWEAISQDVDFLKESPSPGRALTAEEESRLLDAASKSRCRSLYPVVLLAINTGLRAGEIRGLRWQQVDFLGHTLTVGKSKTAAGTGPPHSPESSRSGGPDALTRAFQRGAAGALRFPA